MRKRAFPALLLVLALPLLPAIQARSDDSLCFVLTKRDGSTIELAHLTDNLAREDQLTLDIALRRTSLALERIGSLVFGHVPENQSRMIPGVLVLEDGARLPVKCAPGAWWRYCTRFGCGSLDSARVKSLARCP